MNNIKSGNKIRIRLWVAVASYGSLAMALALLLRRSHTRLLSGVSMVAIVAMLVLLAILLGMVWEEDRFLRKLGSLMKGNDPAAPIEGETLFLDMSENEILGWMFEYLQESSVSRALKTEAELHALQNQINPHFLYNTLEIIRSRAMVQGNTDVAEMVEALAMLFRYCINSPGELATLRQELGNVRDYLLIQRYRYGERFSYQEEIPDQTEDLLDYKLPVMTLQPIIENALVHGINPKIEGGTITLRVEVSQRFLRIIIEDDGVGIEDEALRRIRSALRESAPLSRASARNTPSNGIALDNVNKRIQFYFGGSNGLDIVSTRGVGTSVVMTLPRKDVPGDVVK